MALVGFFLLKGVIIKQEKLTVVISFLSENVKLFSCLWKLCNNQTKGCLFTKGLESYKDVCRQQESTVEIPDLNVMESVWDYMERQKTLKQPKSTEELSHYLQDAEQPTCQVA